MNAAINLTDGFIILLSDTTASAHNNFHNGFLEVGFVGSIQSKYNLPPHKMKKRRKIFTNSSVFIISIFYVIPFRIISISKQRGWDNPKKLTKNHFIKGLDYNWIIISYINIFVNLTTKNRLILVYFVLARV